MNRYLIYIVLLLPLLLAGRVAQAQTVTNVDYYQDGRQVVITYALDQQADITVYYSTNGGRSYSSKLQYVTGDVGENVFPGDHKKLTWDVLMEVNAFTGDNIVFKVEAKKKKIPRTKSGYDWRDDRWFLLFGLDFPGGMEVVEKNSGVNTLFPSSLSLNCTFGAMKKYGWYVHGSITLGSKKTAHYYSLIGGGVARLGKSWRAYVGLGTACQKVDYYKYDYPDPYLNFNRHRWSFATDIGLLFNWGPVGFRAGTTLLFRHGVWAVPSLGVGIYL